LHYVIWSFFNDDRHVIKTNQIITQCFCVEKLLFKEKLYFFFWRLPYKIAYRRWTTL